MGGTVEAVRRLRPSTAPRRLASLAGLLLCALATASAQAQPRYTIERWGALCPQASDPAAYAASGFLEANRVLRDGEDGWMFRSESDLVTQFGPDPGGYRELQRFARKLRARGTELVLIYLPTRGLVHPHRLADRSGYDYERARASYAAALNSFRALGITVPDLTALTGEAPRADAYYFKRDHHWTPYGAQRAAQAVAAAVSTMPAYAGLARKTYSTVRNGMMRKTGTLQIAASRICGYGYSDQWVPTYGTAAEGADGSEALFGDAELPRVVLVGTSFSRSAVSYNFDGYLQEYLGVEILNEAMAGGSFDGAMMQFLPSATFQSEPPKILLWEVPSYYDLGSRQLYRQAVPLVENGCRTRKAALTRTTELKRGGATEVLFNGGGQVLPLKGRDSVIDLQFSDPQIKQLRAHIWYTSGRKDALKLDYGKRVDGQGRFVAELRRDGDWSDLTFLSMDIELPPDAPSGLSVEARICSHDEPSNPADAVVAAR